jgi:hypothetical protein
MAVVIDELSGPNWALTNPGGNATANGFPSRVPSVAGPSLVAAGVVKAGDGVVAIGDQGQYGPRSLLLVPFGVGAATNTFSLQVLGWRATALGVAPLWVPVNLGTWQVTLGTAGGVANSDLGTTQLFATTISQTAGGPTNVTPPDWFAVSPGGNAIGMICLRTLGFRFLEVIYSTGGSATSCNALYAKM